MTPPQEVQLDSWAQGTRASGTNVSTSKTHTDQLLLSREHCHLVTDGSRAEWIGFLFQEADLYGKKQGRFEKQQKNRGSGSFVFVVCFFGMVLKKR